VQHGIAAGVAGPEPARRAVMVLAVAAGARPAAVAAQHGCDKTTVWRVCCSYRRGGLSGLLAYGRCPGGRRLARASVAEAV
jgi:hypothetical protein